MDEQVWANAMGVNPSPDGLSALVDLYTSAYNDGVGHAMDAVRQSAELVRAKGMFTAHRVVEAIALSGEHLFMSEDDADDIRASMLSALLADAK